MLVTDYAWKKICYIFSIFNSANVFHQKSYFTNRVSFGSILLREIVKFRRYIWRKVNHEICQFIISSYFIAWRWKEAAETNFFIRCSYLIRSMTDVLFNSLERNSVSILFWILHVFASTLANSLSRFFLPSVHFLQPGNTGTGFDQMKICPFQPLQKLGHQYSISFEVFDKEGKYQQSLKLNITSHLFSIIRLICVIIQLRKESLCVSDDRFNTQQMQYALDVWINW